MYCHSPAWIATESMLWRRDFVSSSLWYYRLNIYIHFKYYIKIVPKPDPVLRYTNYTIHVYNHPLPSPLQREDRLGPGCAIMNNLIHTLLFFVASKNAGWSGNSEYRPCPFARFSYPCDRIRKTSGILARSSLPSSRLLNRSKTDLDQSTRFI